VVIEDAVTSPTGTQAVDRAASLLREVVDAPEPVTFTELTASTGLAKSTASRLLVALERNGLVQRDRNGAFGPGEVFVRFAWRGDGDAALVELAMPYLEELGRETGETINLGVANGSMVEQVAQVDSRYLLGGANWIGRPVPLHCTALGKVLVAFSSAELPPGRLERRTPRTITTRSALEADLAEVRRRGWAATVEELEPGLVAVAAPVHRSAGTVVAALSVSGPTSRLDTAHLAGVAARCVEQANALSAQLGHRPRREGAA
jgi:DNA-binding IclR family transcriptional regulator